MREASETWRALRMADEKALGIRGDPSTHDMSRLYFDPRHPPAKPGPAPRTVEGPLLSLGELDLPKKEAPQEAPSGQGGGPRRRLADLYTQHVEDPVALLVRHGYQDMGDGRLLAPSSASGKPGVNVLRGADGHWRVFSHHANDPIANAHGRDVLDLIGDLDIAQPWRTEAETAAIADRIAAVKIAESRAVLDKEDQGLVRWYDDPALLALLRDYVWDKGRACYVELASGAERSKEGFIQEHAPTSGMKPATLWTAVQMLRGKTMVAGQLWYPNQPQVFIRDEQRLVNTYLVPKLLAARLPNSTSSHFQPGGSSLKLLSRIG